MSTDAIPPDRRVYVFEDHQADEGGPRSFSPRLAAEALAAAQAGNYRFVSPLPRLIEQALAGGAPIEMVADDPSHFGRGVPLTDYCKVSGARLMVFSRRAADALHALLAPNGRFVPLACDQAELVGYLLETDLDVLDVERSDLASRPVKGRLFISNIYKYAFRTERLGPAIFTANGHRLNDLVLQPFVDIARANRLAGFRFCRVWPAGNERLWSHCRENWV